MPGAGIIKAMFHSQDEDDDGTISHEELARVLKALLPEVGDASISLLFEQIDSNHDGVVQYEEWIDWLMDGSGGPQKGGDTWFDAVEAILAKGLFMTDTGLCGLWSLRKKAGSKRRETYKLLSCGVAYYSMYEARYSGKTCSHDIEEVSGFGEWTVKDGVLTVTCSVHSELVSGSGVRGDRLRREEQHHLRLPASEFGKLFHPDDCITGSEEVRIMLAMFGISISDVNEPDVINALADAAGHSGKAVYLLQAQLRQPQ